MIRALIILAVLSVSGCLGTYPQSAPFTPYPPIADRVSEAIDCVSRVYNIPRRDDDFVVAVVIHGRLGNKVQGDPKGLYVQSSYLPSDRLFIFHETDPQDYLVVHEAARDVFHALPRSVEDQFAYRAEEVCP